MRPIKSDVSPFTCYASDLADGPICIAFIVVFASKSNFTANNYLSGWALKTSKTHKSIISTLGWVIYRILGTYTQQKLINSRFNTIVIGIPKIGSRINFKTQVAIL